MLPFWLRQLKKRFQGQRGGAPIRRLSLESLEDRTVPADVFWTGGATVDVDMNGDGDSLDPGESGDLRWSNPGNWSGATPQNNFLPGPGDNVIFPVRTQTSFSINYRDRGGGFNSLMNLNTTINSLLIQDAGYNIAAQVVRDPQVPSPLIPNNPTVLTILGAISYTAAGSSTVLFRTRLVDESQVFTVTDPGGSLVWGGPISRSPLVPVQSQVGILKLGAGSLTFGGNNTYDGLVQVQQGTLVAANDDALGTTGAATTVSNGATLTVATGNLSESLRISGTGVNGLGALNGGGGITGGITLSPSATIGGALGIDGVITGSGDLTTIGNITLTAANTYNGNTFVNAGVLTITNNDALSPRPPANAGTFTRVAGGATLQLRGQRLIDDEELRLAGGTLRISGNTSRANPAEWRSSIFLESSSSLVIDEGGGFLASGPIANFPGSPNASLTKGGRGTAIFPNANVGFSGDTIINDGTLVMRGAEVLGPATAAGGPNPGDPPQGGSIIVNSSIGAQTFGTLEVQGAYTVNKNLTINGFGFQSRGALKLTDDPNDAGATVIDWAAPVTLGTATSISTMSGTALTISGVLGGSLTASLQKKDPGSLTLTSANTFLGELTLQDGATTITDGEALGGVGGGGTTVTSGASLVLTNTQPGQSGLTVDGETLTLSSEAGATATLRVTSGTNLWTGDVDIDGNDTTDVGPADEVAVSVEGSTTSLEFRNVISGDATFRKLGTGNLLLTGGNSNTFVDPLLVEAGTVSLGKTDGAIAVAGAITVGDDLGGNNADVLRLLAPNQIPDNKNLTINSSGLFDLNGFAETIGGTINAVSGQLILQGGEITTGATGVLNLGANVRNLGAADVAQITGNVFLGGATRTFDFRPGPGVTLSSSANPSQFGNPVTFTFTVTDPNMALTPGGTVQFFDGNTPISNALSLIGGSRSIQVDDLSVGSHTIRAVYSGDANFAGETLILNEPQVVVNPSQALSLTSNLNPSRPDTDVTFTFTIGSNPGDPSPSGTVEFFDGPPSGGMSLGTGDLIDGVAILTTNALTVGVHTIVAVYTGDSSFAASQVSLTNQRIGVPAALQLTSNDNATERDEPIVLTFTAGGLAGDPIPDGTVEFFDGTTSLGTADVNPGMGANANFGVATITVPANTFIAGTRNIRAVYSGDAALYLPGEIALAPAQVVGYTPLIELTSSNNPAVVGAPVTFTATVTADNGDLVPTGTVRFRGTNGATVLFTIDAGLNGMGVATTTFTFAANATGTPTITAEYIPNLGELRYLGGTDTLDSGMRVLAAPSTTVATFVLSSTNNSAQSGEDFAFTYTLFRPTNGTVPTAAGTVEFFINGQSIGTGTFANVNNNGVWTSPTVSRGPGTYTVTANYSGEGPYAPDLGRLLLPNQLVVNPLAARLTSNFNPSPSNTPVTFTFDLIADPNAPDPTAGGATVQFLDFGTAGGPNGAQIGTVQSLDSEGRATVTTPADFLLSNGTHVIRAVYSGNADYAPFTVTLTPGQTVGRPPTMQLSSNLNPVPTASVVVFSFEATGGPNNPVPTGTVQFFSDGVAIGGAVPLVAGSATQNTNSLDPGTHVITARYSGDANYSAGTTLLSVEQIVVSPPEVLLTSDANPSATGSNLTFSFSFQPGTNDDPPATGIVVTFVADGLLGGPMTIGTDAIDGNGFATITLNTLPADTYTITAMFAGNSIYQPLQVTLANQVVANAPLPPLAPPPTSGAASNPILLVNGVISGGAGAGITKTGPGSMTLNAVNTYTGTTTVSGTNGSIVVGVNNAVPNTPVVLTNGGSLNVNGRTETITSLTGTAGTTLALGTGSLTVVTPVGTTDVFSGAITGTGTLIKAGAGTLTLFGASPTYTGTTNVTQGTVLVNANQSGAAVVVAAGATLGGTGTVGAVTANGLIAPGTTGVGTLTAASVNFGGGGTFTVDVTAPATNDRLVVTGATTVVGGILVVNTSFTPTIGATFLILDGTGTITPGFRDSLGNLLGEGANFTSGAGRYSISYAGGDVNITYLGLDVAGVLTPAANPSLPGASVQYTLSLPGVTSGTVTFAATGPDPVAPQTVNVVNGVAQATLTFTAPGSYAVTATFSGTATLATKTFALTQVVNTPTSVSLATSNASAAFGEAVTFTATVTGTPAFGTPTGTVTFVNLTTGQTLGTVGLDGAGQASITAVVPSGANAIQAVYNGSTDYRASASTVTQSVAPAPSPAPSPAPYFSNAFVVNGFLILIGDGLPGGSAIIPVPAGTQAFFTDTNGDGKGDVVLIFPSAIYVLDGATGQIQIVATDFTGDGIRDILIFSPTTGALQTFFNGNGQVIQF